MNARPFTTDHLAVLARWLNDLPGMRGWDADWVWRKTLADPDYDPSLMLVAEAQGEPVGFVVGAVREGQAWIKALVVRPDRQRQGLGSGLLHLVEDRFVQRGVTQATVGWCPRSFFNPGVDVRFAPAAAFLERHGYVTDRTSRVNMDVPLAGRRFDTAEAEERLAAQGIAVARARPEDKAAVGRLAETEGHLIWRDESVEAYHNDPVSMFVAKRAGQVCGFAVHSVTAPVEFGPMLTAPDLRGRGIGTVLLHRCLADLQRQGFRRAEITWVGPIPFYVKAADARVGRVFWEWKKSLDGG